MTLIDNGFQADYRSILWEQRLRLARMRLQKQILTVKLFTLGLTYFEKKRLYA